MVDKRFGEHMKEYRCKLGLTQQEFAEKVELSTGYISALEQGKSFPSYGKLIDIINGLETSADRLFGGLLSYSCCCRTNEINEKLVRLPVECQNCILSVMEMMINIVTNHAKAAGGRTNDQ